MFQENLWRDGRTDRADRQTDRQTEEKTLFYRNLLAMSRGPRETTKEVLIDNFLTLQDLFVGNRHGTRGPGYCRC